MTAAQRKKDYLKKLPQIVSALRRGYKPEKIILFGSLVSHKSPVNDIDLLLIKKTKRSRFGARATEARRFLADQTIPVDMLVYTPQEIDREVNRGNVFISEILEKGKVLYE